MSRTMLTYMLLATLVADSKAKLCGNIADIVFVIDSSSSIWEPYFKQQLQFVQQMVNTFDVSQKKTRIGAINFSNRVVREFHLKTHDSKERVLSAISEVEYTAGDSTNTNEALMVLRTEYFTEMSGDRSDIPNIAILLTDGESTLMADTVSEANLNKERGVSIFAVGIGHNVNQEELTLIASAPKADFMYILENVTELQTEAFTQLISLKACKIIKNDTDEGMCKRIVDVVFVIDSSSSIWITYFKQQLEFVKHLVNAFDVGQGKTRIGAINFSNRHMTEFHLNSYDSKKDILNAVSNVQYTAGDMTNTFDALRLLRTEAFTAVNGDRSDIPNIAILLTDGESSNMASTVKEAKLTREAGVTIFGIGIGDKIKKEELEQIASSPTSDYMHILESFTALQAGDLVKRIIDLACKGKERYLHG
ncbi:hypothetical protein ACJMK2_015327 [Sinanodonta woodiana]|uniref:VWFA domain-containing protein n=1 Tax=Sinanodonta woodiana TaxID=1069815 RepID=A0ABD3V3A6_SINWO